MKCRCPVAVWHGYGQLRLPLGCLHAITDPLYLERPGHLRLRGRVARSGGTLSLHSREASAGQVCPCTWVDDDAHSSVCKPGG